MSAVLPVAVVVVAGLLAGATGFGFSVLAVPLLLPAYPPQDVVVIALFLVPVTSAALLLTPGLRRRIQYRTVAELTVWSILGLPIGILLFEVIDPRWVIAVVGIVLAAYAIYGLRTRRPVAVSRPWVAPSGLLGGVLATSTGLSGPAVAMYVRGRPSGAEQQVATMAAYVSAISVLGLLLLAAAVRSLDRSSAAFLPWWLGRWRARCSAAGGRVGGTLRWTASP